MSAVRIVRRAVPQDADAASWPPHWPLLLRRVHAARGSRDGDAAMPRLSALPPPDGMRGLAEGVAVLFNPFVFGGGGDGHRMIPL